MQANVCLVGENPTCSVPVLWGCEGLWSYDYGHAWDRVHTSYRVHPLPFPPPNPPLPSTAYQALGDRPQYHIYLEEVDSLPEVWDRRRAAPGDLPPKEAGELLLSGRAYAQLPNEVYLVFLKIDRRVSDRRRVNEPFVLRCPRTPRNLR